MVNIVENDEVPVLQNRLKRWRNYEEPSVQTINNFECSFEDEAEREMQN